MVAELADQLPPLTNALEAAADSAKIEQMEAYMRNQFTFLGVTSPLRRAAAKPLLAAGKGSSPDELLDVADQLWELPAREYQYTGMDLLRKYAKTFEPHHLPRVEALIRRKSWWDTIDSLAPWTVGTMVKNHPELAEVMDLWIIDANIWIARSAILHQLSYKESCDAERLFAYVDERAADTEFFIRKASGWALRQHARTDPDAVVSYIDRRAEDLSGLTKREALKHLS